MKKTHLAISVLLMTVALFSVTTVQASVTVIETRPLLAGQHIHVGTLTVAFDGANLIITFETTDDWKLYETHLYLGTTPPAKSAPGQFPYGHDSLPGVTSDPYTVPLTDLGANPGDTLYIAAHAVVCKCGCDCETAWAEGCGRFYNGGGRIKGWAMWGDFTVPS